MKTITVLLAEDHTIVREGLRAFLETAGHFEIVGEAATGREAVALAKKLRPTVVVMDIAMPELNGCEATRQILLALPATKVVVLTAHSDDEYVDRLLEVGAVGFLAKQSCAEMLAAAIRQVVSGTIYLGPTIVKRRQENARKARARGDVPGKANTHLTAREAEVLQLVAEGAANKQIAGQLGISSKTVEKHRQRLMDKLDIHETAGLTRYAIASGSIESAVQVTIV